MQSIEQPKYHLHAGLALAPCTCYAQAIAAKTLEFAEVRHFYFASADADKANVGSDAVETRVPTTRRSIVK
jgi:hypothetical protein